MRYWLTALFCLVTYLALLSCEQPPEEGAGPQVRIGRLICGGHLPLAVVEHLYQDRLTGFHLHTVQNHDWNNVLADMRSGRLAGTFILAPLAMQLIHEGFAGKIVLLADRNGNGFILSEAIKTIDALNLQKHVIAVPHVYSQQHLLLNRLLRQHGVSPEQVLVLAMPPRDMIGSLKRGEIDGFLVGEPESNKSVNLGVGWLAARSPDIWPNHADHVFLASEQFIQQHPEQLQQLINALVTAKQYIEQNPHQAAKMGEAYTGSSADVFEQVLTSPPNWIDYRDLLMREDDLRAMAEQLVAMKLWPNVPADLARYVDNRFAQKAQVQLGEQRGD